MNVTFQSFDPILGLTVVGTAYLAGITSASGGILAGARVYGGLFYRITDQWLGLGGWYDAATGIGLILTVVLNPEGIEGPSTLGSRGAALANRAGIVLVLDERALFTTLTVGENIAAAAHKGGATRQDVLELFPALTSRWNVRAGAISGGEQQMLAVARWP